ncbi:pyridoxal-phosphate dependent enzyme [Streptomyces sp. NPDC026206]|uniref:pyridoxal-phosphate dependent enzyme n=1 Tax=Streptomyces sp. NPDC026206 TaxID=3157089 RepID=UPI0033CCA92C
MAPSREIRPSEKSRIARLPGSPGGRAKALTSLPGQAIMRLSWTPPRGRWRVRYLAVGLVAPINSKIRGHGFPVGEGAGAGQSRGGVLVGLADGHANPPREGGSFVPLTPVVALQLSVDGYPATLWLKLESHNPHGSVKGRTALALWRDVVPRVDPEFGIIESTSGNLGLALAAVAAGNQVPFTAVVDPRSSASLVDAVRALDGRVVTVDEPDGAGGYLLSRLAYIEERLAAQPRLVWPNQYANPANPAVHARETAPELRAQIRERPTSVLVAVSTGGTLAGFRRYVLTARPEWELVGVDVVGSAALGGTSGRRVLSGIGASRPSAFLPDGYRPTVWITPQEAVSACLWLAETTGLGIGGSSGALIASALRLFRATPRRTSVACLCPDGADRYLDSVYSTSWRDRQGLVSVDIGRGVEILAVHHPPRDPAAGGAAWSAARGAPAPDDSPKGRSR